MAPLANDRHHACLPEFSLQVVHGGGENGLPQTVP